MTKLFTFVFATFLPLAALAQTTDTETDALNTETDAFVVLQAAQVQPDDFLWLARPVVVFADSENDPRFTKQIELLRSGWDALRMRDVVVIADTNPSEKSAFRLKLRPRGFMMALVAKDGTVALRKPAPWTERELSRSIDKMPLREQEIRDRRQSQ